jgi:hypothetical protein
MAMSRYEHWIRRYEHRRWTTDDNRMVRPFEWGLEHLEEVASEPSELRVNEGLFGTQGKEVASEEWQVAGTTGKLQAASGKGEDPREFVRKYAREAIEKSEEWYATEEVKDYRLDAESVLTFTSTLKSAWPENNVVHAQVFRGKKVGPAVLILPNWNAKWHGQVALCHWLQRMGITAMKMSLPYHDRRMAKGHERADQLVGPNIGLTLQANRQAVKDARACLTWLEQQGYDRLGILGTSIGSSVGYITLVHDRRVRAGGFFHVSTYFADVVSQGMTTNHVWQGLRHEVSVEELREFWAPVSPMPFVERGMGAGRNTFMVYGKYDPTFLPELTEKMLAALRKHGAEPRTLELPVGHYSLELAPFSYIAGYRMFTYFLEALG